MLYQLPNGRCVEISLEQYLRMTDDELHQYVALNLGSELNDPFAISVLKYGPAKSYEEGDFLDDDDVAIELPEATIEDKIEDGDYLPEVE